ncbi:hypothetical protein JL475_37380 [Streptomyces sp. M2CJ-2]|nr:hypothetical protein [Streptomyces sp. M2CJ-2]MBL3671465.1 hypothetical protein [Streptomyces sp. M2CJ-2]
MQEHGNQKGTKPRTSKNEDVSRPSEKTSGADAVVKKARDNKVANMKA